MPVNFPAIWHNKRFCDHKPPTTVINGLNRLFARARNALVPDSGRTSQEPTQEPEVIDFRRHGIDRGAISPNALKVLNRLRDGGHDAFIVGGGVRDLLLGREPKDFDVATDALPEEVKRLFRNCRLIGRRFRLAHVFFGREIIEVATFRASSDDGSGARRVESGRLVRDNVYGGIEDDAVRRDFTINALYYDAHANEVLDFTNGFADLKDGMLRLIGDPASRFREDPVRLLRAARFAAKLGFRIHPGTETHMPAMGALLDDIAPARLYDEVVKLLLTGHGLASFEQLRHYGLFEHLFPDTEASLRGEEEGFPRTLISHALANTDDRVAEGKPVIPAFIFAALLWDPMRLKAEELMEDEGLGEREALDAAAEWIIKRQIRNTSIPKRASFPMREIWMLQPRFNKKQGKGAIKLLEHPRFRAAYDFLLMRAKVDDSLKELAEWWTEFQKLPPGAQRRKLSGGKKRRRGRRGRKSGGDNAADGS